MDLLSPDTLIILFGVAVAAGFVDSIAGGGGLLALPALLAVGLGPVEALATNKLQGTAGTLSATVNFVRGGHVDPMSLRAAIVWTFVGAAAGTVSVQLLAADFLDDVIPALLVASAVYVLLSPRAGDVDAHRRLGEAPFAMLFGVALGFYDGFFGPGTGSLWAVAWVAVLGHNLRRATAETKVVNLTSNVASLLFFVAGGHVAWGPGLVMAAGQIAGAWAGSHLVIRRGAGLVRPVLVVVSLAITARLVLGD